MSLHYEIAGLVDSAPASVQAILGLAGVSILFQPFLLTILLDDLWSVVPQWRQSLNPLLNVFRG